LTTDPSDAPQNYYINVRTNTRAVHYSEDYVTYRFAGYDRNGLIDDEDDNPELTFAIGDNIYFTFDDNSLFSNLKNFWNFSFKPSNEFFFKISSALPPFSELILGNIGFENKGLKEHLYEKL